MTRNDQALLCFLVAIVFTFGTGYCLEQNHSGFAWSCAFSTLMFVVLSIVLVNSPKRY